MVNSNFKLVIGLAVILVVIFSGIVVRYSLKADPMTVDHSEKKVSQLGDTKPDDETLSDGESVLNTDADLLTTLGGDSSEVIDLDEPVQTQSTEKQDNRRKTETTTTAATTTTSTTSATDNSARKQKAGEELDASAARFDEAGEKLDKAKSELSDAKSKRDQRQAEFESAKSKLDEAKRNYDEGQKENYNRGIYAFFESVGANDALDVLNSSEYNSALEPSKTGDAGSLECMKRSIDFLNEANQLRGNEEKPELQVSYKMIALAVLNNDMTAASSQGSNNTGLDEDLAFGYDDPFRAWYDDERESNGGNYRSLTNEDYVVAGFAFSSKNGTVHNLLLADKNYDSGELMSVADYASAFNSFYDSAVKGKAYTAQEEEYKRAEKALNEAKQVVTDKENSVQSASAAYGSAKTIYEQKLKTYQSIK